MKITIRPLFYVCLILLLSACRSSQKSSSKTENSTDIVLLNKVEAEKKIVIDRTDGFFEKITIPDMSIQMKNADVPTDRSKVLAMYKDLLKDDMMDFSEEDAKFIHEVFLLAKAHIDKINPKLWPANMEIYKTKTNHYGPSVYYTRENGIIIPEDVFEEASVEAQMPVMLHEIFHILSRYNDDFRDKMYALIGFKEHKLEIKIPQKLKTRMLTNPDGTRTDYAIYLEDTKGEIQPALPLLMATKERYTKDVPTFFGYLQFDLFPIEKQDGGYTLGIDDKGESTLSLEHNSDFFKKIKDNTQYIIHPDEVLADNFMMALIANERGNFDGFSPEGTALMKDVLSILKDFEQ